MTNLDTVERIKPVTLAGNCTPAVLPIARRYTAQPYSPSLCRVVTITCVSTYTLKGTLEARILVALGNSFLVSWGGVRLSLFGTSATNWPIVPAPYDR
jgi:hypothetical protein